MAALQSLFPKLTLVAEVNNPEAFGKGLDAVIIAINGELKAQAMEKAREEQAAAEKGTGGAAGGNQGGRRMAPGGGGDRTKRRRSLRDTPAPRFTLSRRPARANRSS